MAVIPGLSDATWDVFPSGQDMTIDYPRWWPIGKRIKQTQTNRIGFKESPHLCRYGDPQPNEQRKKIMTKVDKKGIQK
jgi:hypothetical protein